MQCRLHLLLHDLGLSVNPRILRAKITPFNGYASERHRTEERYRLVEIPLCRMREALSFLWLTFPPMVPLFQFSGWLMSLFALVFGKRDYACAPTALFAIREESL